MRCPLCSPLQVVEEPLLKHLLRDHPEAQAIAAISVPVGTAFLSRRPQQLLLFYLVVLALATGLWLAPHRAA